MARTQAAHTIIHVNSRGNEIKYTDTILGLIKTFAYILEVGASYQHEKGNSKINENPKGITSLVKNLNNAKNNAAANGFSGQSYYLDD